MPLIDSHCHLTDERFHADVDAVLARAHAAGVAAMVTIGSELESSRAAAALAARAPGVHAAVGIHPHDADSANPEALAALRELARSPRVVALGETGLDYHYDHAPREAQRAAFAAHLELARELGLPVVVHARDADDDLVALLREAGQGTRGVLHCFSSGERLLEAALAMGWYASFAGMITFKRYDAADLLRRVPLERLLVETDSPYLAPVPHRGQRNEPAFVVEVARRAAELRGEPFAQLAAATTRNACALYGIAAQGAVPLNPES